MSQPDPQRSAPPSHDEERLESSHTLTRTPAAKTPEVVAPKADGMQLDDKGLYRMLSQQDEYRIAKMLLDTGAVPKAFQAPQQVMMAIQALKSLGLNWRTALRQCGYNAQGAFMVYGDLELAVVRQSGLLEAFEEYLVVQGEDGKLARRSLANQNIMLAPVAAVCAARRKGEECLHEESFSIEDAKVAGLWGKTPTWRNFPGRMMQMRARGLLIRNLFSDVTQGLAGVEYDAEGIDYDRK